MSGKQKFLMVHDYQHGGVGFWAYGRSASELESLFKGFVAREVYDESQWKNIKLPEFDIDKEPEGVIVAYIANAQGKKEFRCQFEVGEEVKEVIVHAHNIEKIEFSNLIRKEPAYLPGVIYGSTTPPVHVDIDHPADYMLSSPT